MPRLMAFHVGDRNIVGTYMLALVRLEVVEFVDDEFNQLVV